MLIYSNIFINSANLMTSKTVYQVSKSFTMPNLEKNGDYH